MKALSPSDRKAPEQRASFRFQRAVNVIDQGRAVPIIYGDCMVGSPCLSQAWTSVVARRRAWAKLYRPAGIAPDR